MKYIRILGLQNDKCLLVPKHKKAVKKGDISDVCFIESSYDFPLSMYTNQILMETVICTPCGLMSQKSEHCTTCAPYKLISTYCILPHVTCIKPSYF